MSTLNNLKMYEMETFKKSIELRQQSVNDRSSYKKSLKVRNLQQEYYDKNKFIKGLLKHWKEEEKNEEN